MATVIIPIEEDLLPKVVDNITTEDSSSALSAKQGTVLASEVSTIKDKVTQLAARGAIRGVVANYAELGLVQTSRLVENDTYIVEQDETHDGQTTVYSWSRQGWVFAGLYQITLNANKVNCSYNNLSTDLQSVINDLVSQINALKTRLSDVETKANSIPSISFSMVLDNQITGINQTFNLSETVSNYILIYNGQVMAIDDDYEINGLILTTKFNIPPKPGDKLWINYWK